MYGNIIIAQKKFQPGYMYAEDKPLNDQNKPIGGTKL